MLAASRDKLVARLQAGAQEMRWMELDSIMGRYAGMIGVTSLGAGFAFSAMVELDVPENPSRAEMSWIYAFYMLTAISLICSLYVVSFSAMAIAAGNRLALQGTEQSTTRAVAVLLRNFSQVFVASTIVLLSIIGASMCIVYIKMTDDHLEEATGILFGVGMLFILYSLQRLRNELKILPEEMVTGAVTVGSGANQVDLTQVGIVGSSADIERQKLRG